MSAKLREMIRDQMQISHAGIVIGQRPAPSIGENLFKVAVCVDLEMGPASNPRRVLFVTDDFAPAP